MGRGDGVEVRAASIRLFFVWNGQRYRETLTVNGKPMKPTAPNVLHAKRVAAKIRQQIELGTFTLAEHFPDSPRAELAQVHTFGQLAKKWLQSVSPSLQPATVDQYTNAVKVYSDTCWLAEKNEHDQFIQDVRYQPSIDWSLGGQIIERERISTIERGAEGWMADMRGVSPIVGPTPLIAAMRAYVASKLGEEVELP